MLRGSYGHALTRWRLFLAEQSSAPVDQPQRLCLPVRNLCAIIPGHTEAVGARRFFSICRRNGGRGLSKKCGTTSRNHSRSTSRTVAQTAGDPCVPPPPFRLPSPPPPPFRSHV